MGNKLIGFAGRKRVGKDTAGHYLALKGWQKYSMARPLRELVANMCDMSIRILEHDKLKEEKFEKPLLLGEQGAQAFMQHVPWETSDTELINKIMNKIAEKEVSNWRELLQFIGTDICRDMIDPDIWIKIGKAKIDRRLKETNIYISDVRFENERDLVHDLGGKVIRVIRDTGVTDSHSSELTDFECDYEIDNNYSLVKLGENIENYLKEIYNDA